MQIDEEKYGTERKEERRALLKTKNTGRKERGIKERFDKRERKKITESKNDGG